MKHYLKIENNKIIEAPKTLVNGDKIIYGYNHQSNDTMLKQDGYTAYPKGVYAYEIKDGVIVEKEYIQPQQTVFSKLQIRRACRSLGIEDKLDFLLNLSEQIKSDWNDAQDIDLADEMFVRAIEQGVFTEQEIQTIKEIAK